MKKLLTTAVAGLIFVGTANAQGTWYTDYNTWLNKLTSPSNKRIADYNGLPTNVLGANPYVENFVSVEATSALFGQSDQQSISVLSNTATMTFKYLGDPLNPFVGNAFGGFFATTDLDEEFASDGLTFVVDGIHSEHLATSGTAYTFFGYISDSTSTISVDVTGDTEYVTVDSFTFGNGVNATNPGSAVPEPGEYVSMAILGIGLCGMLVRSRRNKKS